MIQQFRSLAGRNVGVLAVPIILACVAAPARAENQFQHEFYCNNPCSELVGHHTSGQKQSWGLFGTTPIAQPQQYGIAYKWSPPPPGSHTGWTQTILYEFKGHKEGEYPYPGLAFDQSGAAYGINSYRDGAQNRFGSIFKLTPPPAGQSSWTKTAIYNFPAEYLFLVPFGPGIYAEPLPNLIVDASGALYGTAITESRTYGIAFKLTPPAIPSGAWTYATLHKFSVSEGYSLRRRMVMDRTGALYGTTEDAGAFKSGTVFKLTPPPTKVGAWSYSRLYSFGSTGKTGPFPTTQLVLDSAGAVYGGMNETLIEYDGRPGAIFRLQPPASGASVWTPSIVHAFTGPDGAAPESLMVCGSALCGITKQGGAFDGGTNGSGTVFQLTPPAAGKTAWTASVLHSFQGAPPALSLAIDDLGNLYGPYETGSVFKLYRP